MPAWRTTLHPPVIRSAEHQAIAEKALARLADRRPTPRLLNLAPVPDSYDIPLSTISAFGLFDSLTNV